MRLGIGRKFQTPTVFPSLTVYQNLEVASGFRQTVAAAASPPAQPPTQRTAIEDVLETVGLTEQRDDLAGALSHGELQWLEIGMLLVQDPKLLLLDEPVAGMTRPERDETGAAPAVDRGRPLDPGRRARHGVRARVRADGERAAPGQDAQRGPDGGGPERPAGDRGLSRASAHEREARR